LCSAVNSVVQNNSLWKMKILSIA